MITQEMIDHFCAKHAEAFEKNLFIASHFEREKPLLDDIITGRRTLWVEIECSEPTISFPVYTLEELKAVTDTYRTPCLLAVKAGYDLETASKLDNDQREQGLEIEERYVIFVGEFDERGAQCGVVMSILLPRSPLSPQVLIQEMIDLYGVDENGKINIPDSFSPKRFFNSKDDINTELKNKLDQFGIPLEDFFKDDDLP